MAASIPTFATPDPTLVMPRVASAEQRAGRERVLVPFSAGVQRPRSLLPPGACDSHIHFYDRLYPVAAGAELLPPDASVADYRTLQLRIGTQRAVVVTPSTYGCDNRSMLTALEALGPDARGVAVLDGTEEASELAITTR